MSTLIREYRCKNCGESIDDRRDRCPMCGAAQSLEPVQPQSNSHNIDPTLEVLSGFCLAVIALLMIRIWSVLGILLLLIGVPLLLFVMGIYYRVLAQLGPDDPEAQFAIGFRQWLKVLLGGMIVFIVILVVMLFPTL